MKVKDLIKNKDYKKIDWNVRISASATYSYKIFLTETSSKNGQLIYPPKYNYAKYSLREDCEVESYREISPNSLEIIVRGCREEGIRSAVPYGGVFMPEYYYEDNYGPCAPRKLVADYCEHNFRREIYQEKSKLLKYLKSGKILGKGVSEVYDCVMHETIGQTMCYYTDGEYEWDNAIIYHFEKYDSKLENHFVRKILK